MKQFISSIRSIMMIALLLTSLSVFRVEAQSGSYQMFYDELAPYGQWIQDTEYGYVWVPDAGNDFRPYYTNGRWLMTEYGNTWVSDYAWGWAPFHYGRWTFNNFYGWIWIPGNVWGPAWVSWRTGGGYYGWAPLGPGINLSISFGNNYMVPDIWWTFIPCRYIYHHNYHRYWRGANYNTTIIHNTTIINNTYNNTYVYGPRRDDIERHTGKRMDVYQLHNENQPGKNTLRNNTMHVYRPEIKEPGNKNKPAPAQYVRAEKPVVTTSGSTAIQPQTRTPAMQQNTVTPRQSVVREQQQTSRPAAKQQPATQSARQRDQQMQKAPQRNTAVTPRQSVAREQQQPPRPAAKQQPATQSARQRDQQMQKAPQRNTAVTPRQSVAREQQQTSRPATRQQPARQRDQQMQKAVPQQRQWQRPEPGAVHKRTPAASQQTQQRAAPVQRNNTRIERR